MNTHTVRALLLTGSIIAASAATGGVGSAAQPPNCQANDVVITFKEQYMTRLSYGYVDINAKRGVVCTLFGYPTKFRLFDRAGNQVGKAQRGSQQPELVTLTEDSTAHIDMAWDNFFSEVTPETLRLRLPGASASNSAAWSDGSMFDGSFGYGPVEPGPSPEVCPPTCAANAR